MNPELANRVRRYTTHTPHVVSSQRRPAGTGVRMDTIGSREVCSSSGNVVAANRTRTCRRSHRDEVDDGRDARQSRNGDGRCSRQPVSGVSRWVSVGRLK